MEQSKQMNQDATRMAQPGQVGQGYGNSVQGGAGRSQDCDNRGKAGPSQGRELREGEGGGGGGGRGAASSQTTTIVPPVDIFEDDSGFTVVADMPGVSREQLGVRVTGDNLVIEGTATAPVTGDMELLYGEVNNPQYRRSFTLSRELDPSRIEARLNNGVLRLTIPKAEEARPRRIDVSVG